MLSFAELERNDILCFLFARSAQRSNAVCCVLTSYVLVTSWGRAASVRTHRLLAAPSPEEKNAAPQGTAGAGEQLVRERVLPLDISYFVIASAVVFLGCVCL
jgi:hypothetical protein